MYISDPARPFQVPTPVAGSRADILLQNSANINVDRSQRSRLPQIAKGDHWTAFHLDRKDMIS